MKQINETLLECDVAYRFDYVSQFIGFGADDVTTLHGAGPALAPFVPAIVDAVYDQLFKYDCTKRHFVPRHSGYEGEAPESIETLTVHHEMIRFRKGHLEDYLFRLTRDAYDKKLIEYLDKVGKMHTSHAGSQELNVPLVQMNALMGFIAVTINDTILGLGLDRKTEVATLLAFNKLLWIQNDLITRHYQE